MHVELNAASAAAQRVAPRMNFMNWQGGSSLGKNFRETPGGSVALLLPRPRRRRGRRSKAEIP